MPTRTPRWLAVRLLFPSPDEAVKNEWQRKAEEDKHRYVNRRKCFRAAHALPPTKHRAAQPPASKPAEWPGTTNHRKRASVQRPAVHKFVHKIVRLISTRSSVPPLPWRRTP